jgi:F-box/leucine-rich repeat protein 10/11
MLFLQCPGMEGVVNEDLPNSWECPKCCKEGKNVEYRVSEECVYFSVLKMIAMHTITKCS